MPVLHCLAAPQVRNRTAQELNDGTPLEKVRKAEGDFFRNHPQLSKVHPERRGIAALVAELARLQMQRVAKSLPDVKKQVGRWAGGGGRAGWGVDVGEWRMVWCGWMGPRFFSHGSCKAWCMHVPNMP